MGALVRILLQERSNSVKRSGPFSEPLRLREKLDYVSALIPIPKSRLLSLSRYGCSRQAATLLTQATMVTGVSRP